MGFGTDHFVSQQYRRAVSWFPSTPCLGPRLEKNKGKKILQIMTPFTTKVGTWTRPYVRDYMMSMVCKAGQ